MTVKVKQIKPEFMVVKPSQLPTIDDNEYK